MQSSGLWDKALSAVAATTIVILVSFLVVRNQPFSDPNLVVFVRIMLSFATAVLGATIPGTLSVTWSGKGLAVRAVGAISLFFLTFFFTPTALVSSPPPAPTPSPAIASPKKKTIGVSIGNCNGLHVTANEPAEFSPYPVYFGSDYDKKEDSYYPNFAITPAVKNAATQTAQWIAGFGDSVKCVVLFAHVDSRNSTEFALSIGEQGGNIVAQLLADNGINRDHISIISHGREDALPLFEAGTKKLAQNYNDYISIAVVL